MECTIITTIFDREFLTQAISHGLNSLTVSYDGRGGKDRTKKMQEGIKILNAFDIADKACVMTVGAFNEDVLIETAEEILQQGWWLLFDLLHPAHPYGKCHGNVKEISTQRLQEFLAYLIEQKKSAKKIHTSLEYLQYLSSHYAGNVRDVWHCQHKRMGWVTVDFDGELLPCDDYQIRSGIKIWEIDTQWNKFQQERHRVVSECRGCAWNTHFDAVNITETQDFGTYIHTRT